MPTGKATSRVTLSLADRIQIREAFARYQATSKEEEAALADLGRCIRTASIADEIMRCKPIPGPNGKPSGSVMIPLTKKGYEVTRVVAQLVDEKLPPAVGIDGAERQAGIRSAFRKAVEELR